MKWECPKCHTPGRPRLHAYEDEDYTICIELECRSGCGHTWNSFENDLIEVIGNQWVKQGGEE